MQLNPCFSFCFLEAQPVDDGPTSSTKVAQAKAPKHSSTKRSADVLEPADGTFTNITTIIYLYIYFECQWPFRLDLHLTFSTDIPLSELASVAEPVSKHNKGSSSKGLYCIYHLPIENIVFRGLSLFCIL